MTDCIQEWILRVAGKSVDSIRDTEPDICLVEVGGTVGDIESSVYLEALQHLFMRLPRDGYCLAHVTYIPQLGSEQKTKPAQHSFKALREAGVAANFVFGRSEHALTENTKRKLSIFSGVPESHVISLPDAKTNYLVPDQLIQQDLGRLLTAALGLPDRKATPLVSFKNGFTPVALWSELSKRLCHLPEHKPVHIGIVGKYMGSNDTYLSVVKALEHSACESNVNLRINWIQAEFLTNNDDQLARDQWVLLKSVQGILAPGGFGDRGILGKVAAAKYAREGDIYAFM